MHLNAMMPDGAVFHHNLHICGIYIKDNFMWTVLICMTQFTLKFTNLCRLLEQKYSRYSIGSVLKMRSLKTGGLR